MIPQTFKKIIPLLFLSLAIFAFVAQSLLAGEITVKNNSDAHLFISFMKADGTQWRSKLTPGEPANDPNLSVKNDILEAYNHGGDLDYHLGLDMVMNKEKQDGDEPIQIYSKNKNKDIISWDDLKNGKVDNTHTFYTINRNDDLVSRDLTVNFIYNKSTGQLNVIINGTK